MILQENGITINKWGKKKVKNEKQHMFDFEFPIFFVTKT